MAAGSIQTKLEFQDNATAKIQALLDKVDSLAKKMGGLEITPVIDTTPLDSLSSKLTGFSEPIYVPIELDDSKLDNVNRKLLEQPPILNEIENNKRNIKNTTSGWGVELDGVNKILGATLGLLGIQGIRGSINNIMRDIKGEITARHRLQVALENQASTMADLEDYQGRVLELIERQERQTGINATVWMEVTSQLVAYTNQLRSAETILESMGDLLVSRYGSVTHATGQMGRYITDMGRALSGNTRMLHRMQLNISAAEESAFLMADEFGRAQMISNIIQRQMGGVAEAINAGPLGATYRWVNAMNEVRVAIGAGIIPITAYFLDLMTFQRQTILDSVAYSIEWIYDNLPKVMSGLAALVTMMIVSLGGLAVKIGLINLPILAIGASIAHVFTILGNRGREAERQLAAMSVAGGTWYRARDIEEMSYALQNLSNQAIVADSTLRNLAIAGGILLGVFAAKKIVFPGVVGIYKAMVGIKKALAAITIVVASAKAAYTVALTIAKAVIVAYNAVMLLAMTFKTGMKMGIMMLLTGIGLLTKGVIVLGVKMVLAFAKVIAPILLVIAAVVKLIQWFRETEMTFADVMGFIFGLLNVLRAMFLNTVNAIQYAWNNGMDGLTVAFNSFLDFVLSGVQAIARAFDRIPFVGGGLEASVANLRSGVQDTIAAAEARIGTGLELYSLQDMFEAGQEAGAAFADRATDFIEDTSRFFGSLGDVLEPFDPADIFADGMLRDTPQFDFDPDGALRTRNSGPLEISRESLRLIHDIATVRYFQNYRSITPQMTVNATINNGVDAKQVINNIEDAFERASYESLEFSMGSGPR